MRLRDVSYGSTNLRRKELEAFHRNKSPLQSERARLDGGGLTLPPLPTKKSLCVQELAYKGERLGTDISVKGFFPLTK